MKRAILKSAIVIVIAIITGACTDNAQNKTVNDAKNVQSAIKENMPGGIAVSADGYIMRAKINGKQWEATSMMSPEVGRIIGDNNGESISLPLYGGRAKLVEGKKTTFSEDDAADLSTNDDVGIWGGRKGEMEITKVDKKFAEGKFFFTGSSTRSGKTLEVTDGYFRVPLK